MSESSLLSSTIPGSDTDGTSEKPKPFAGHRDEIYAICYSPDGKQIVTGGRRPPIRIWDSATGEMLLEPNYANDVYSVCYSPDRKRLVSLHAYGMVSVWDPSDGELILGPVKKHSFISQITYSADNRLIASAGRDGKVRIWVAEDLTQMREIKQREMVTSVNFSPDGSRLATGCDDYKIRIFDVDTGTLVIGPLEGHAQPITAVTFSPNGEQLASCSGDETIRTWDASTGSALLGPLEGHIDCVACVVYSPDGRYLCSRSWDKTIRLWDSQTGVLVGGPARGHDAHVRTVSFAPDGTRFVTAASDGSMRVWDAHTLEVLLPELTEGEKDRFRLTGPFRGHIAGIFAVAYFPDGDRIATLSGDGTIRIWDVRTGKNIVGPLEGHNRRVKSIAISSDGSRLVSLGANTIRVWDTRTGKVVLGPIETRAPQVWVRFSPNDKLIASSDYCGGLCLWNAETGEQLRSMDAGDSIYSFAFSVDGNRLATGGYNSSILLWDVPTLKFVAGPFRGHVNVITSVAFSPDGLSIASGSEDFTVRLWDATTGAIILGPLKAHFGTVNSVSYSPDGTRICSASSDGTVYIWHAETGDFLFSLLDGRIVHSAAFSPDGKRIVTGSDDWTIRFWDAVTGEIIQDPDTRDDQSGSSFLDMPVTRQVLPAEPTQEIGRGSILDLPATTGLPRAVTAVDDGRVAGSTFSFSRLRRIIANAFHHSRSTSDAIELQERPHRWVPRPIRTAYVRTKSYVVIASRTRPREQALRDVSDHGTASDSGSARQRTGDDENVATESANAAGVSSTQLADAATGGAAQRQSQHGPPSMQASAPYVAPSSSEVPRVYFTPGSVESDDSFEADCCACCPRWCTCLHP